MADVGTPSIGLPLCDPILIDNANNYYPSRTSFEAIGHGSTINNTRIDVCNIGANGAAAAYVVPPVGGIQMRVVSTSAADDGSPVGTGIRTLMIHYLDANYAVQSEVLTLNGTTAVSTTALDILRIQHIHAVTVGSATAAVGQITVENTAGTVVYARIEIGYNSGRNAMFTIPAGKTGYLTHWNVFSGTDTGTHYTRTTLRLSTHDHILLPDVFIAHDSMGFENGGSQVYYDIPIRIPEKTDIKVSAVSDAANANAHVNSHFSGWYE